jgi:hypothetical protein
VVGIFTGKSYSRSGTGVEAKTNGKLQTVRSGSWEGIGPKYVSRILRDFKNTIRGK